MLMMVVVANSDYWGLLIFLWSSSCSCQHRHVIIVVVIIYICSWSCYKWQPPPHVVFISMPIDGISASSLYPPHVVILSWSETSRPWAALLVRIIQTEQQSHYTNMSTNPEAIDTQGESINDSWPQEEKAYTSKKPGLRTSHKTTRKHVN